MGLRRRLTEMQRRFALNLVNRRDLNGKQCAEEAGYKNGNVRASELQNPKRFPLVTKYIDELRVSTLNENKALIAGHLKDFNFMIQQAKRSLEQDMKKGNHRKVIQIGRKFKEIFDVFYYRQKIIVYLAEETRPYKTAHYKIGKTMDSVEARSSGRADNPFGLNYIGYFEYTSENGFNLERTLHSFFKNFSTYNSTYNTTASEWFTMKKRKIMVKYFIKVGNYLLQRHRCMNRYIECGNGGYYKK